MATVQVDRAQSDAMNLQVLKRQDSDVMEIVDTASHVVMYEFDQDNQSWKRKEVEGCLFVVKRFSTPRFQVFVNNRLSTTNMTLAIDEHLQVSSVDSFLILRCPDASYASGYAIYGVWFFPEEDREKILNLLTRVVQSLKEPQAAIAPAPVATATTAPEPTVQQQQQPKTLEQPARTRSRSRSKRGDTNGRRQSGNVATSGQSQQVQPVAILQRSPRHANNKATGLPPTPPTAATTELQHEPTGMRAISREDGIAAGVAILGMISQNRSPSPQTTASASPSARSNKGRNQSRKQQQQQQPPAATATVDSESATAAVSKEQLKQTLIALLDDAPFFDQIYHAYNSRVHARPAL